MSYSCAVSVDLEGWQMTRAKLPRRRFLQLTAGVAAFQAVVRIASAEAYPTRPVRIIVGFPPGAAHDISARIIAQWLSERLKQTVFVENRAGADGSTAAAVVASAPPDGCTLLLVGAPHAINASYYSDLRYSLTRDLVGVSGIVLSPLVLVTHPSVPAKTVPELIAYAKANPDKLNMASGGNGNITHLAGELFKLMTGARIVHVPYRGGAPAVTDVVAGQMQLYFGPTQDTIEQIRSGNLRPLAVGAAARLADSPEVPTIGESVPGYEATGWNGLAAPKNTRSDVVELLSREINAGLANPAIKTRFANLGAPVLPLAAIAFTQFITDEIDKWAKVIQTANIKPA
jgi:tripartite-type tricarboxylate transporter receptor subunit TctC